MNTVYVVRAAARFQPRNADHSHAPSSVTLAATPTATGIGAANSTARIPINSTLAVSTRCASGVMTVVRLPLTSVADGFELVASQTKTPLALTEEFKPLGNLFGTKVRP